ncbi:MAG: hypothetical protein A2854_01390 [Parcubacteria group bacterium RIFCSPHIGHO2_01_FULL_56_18]|nr:MAG: hypothetical protein A2854_01390 [Parcubacteria group bacterium RIFCSPHIGHO2_01_FULL_56_18]
MHFFREMKWTPLNILKATVVAIVVLIFASFIFSFVKSSFDSMPFGMPGTEMAVSQGAYYGADYDMPMEDAYGYGGGRMGMGLSARNVGIAPSIAPVPPMPGGGYSMGNTAEQYEVTEYSATYETQDKNDTCTQLAGLKSYSYVIFESANDHDRGCDYRFKVEHARVDEILGFLKGLGPKDLNENTYTIKSQVDDYTSETEVLENKRRAIDETLEDAIKAYDDITALATANQDAESLARIIDSKIQLIERLTSEKTKINTQLDRIARSKVEQLDRLAYTYFNVSAYENRYVDGENLADSWKDAVRATIHDVNEALQATTLGLVALLFIAIQWIIYGLIVLFIARHVWNWVRRIWTGKPVSASAPKNGSRTRSKSVGGEVENR